MNVKEHWDKLNPSKKKLAVISVIIDQQIHVIAAESHRIRIQMLPGQ